MAQPADAWAAMTKLALRLLNAEGDDELVDVKRIVDETLNAHRDIPDVQRLRNRLEGFVRDVAIRPVAADSRATVVGFGLASRG